MNQGGFDVIACDFETYSPLDLSVVGAHNYASHPKTGVHCFSYGEDQDDIKIWKEGDPFPSELLDYVARGGKFSAWNARFEILMWNQCCVGKYGWPKIDYKQFSCTMAQSYASAYPGRLSDAAEALRIHQKKDLKGQRVMLRLCQEKKKAGGGFWSKVEDPDAFEILYEYNKQDVRVELLIREKLPPLNPFESRLWEIDYKINEEVGVPLDLVAVALAKKLASSESARLDVEMSEATRHAITRCGQSVALKAWANTHPGVSMLGVAKADVASALADATVPDNVKVALRIREDASKTSTKKLDAMTSLSTSRGRVMSTMQYHGANTGRWAGRGIQVQNLPRGGLCPRRIEDVINNLGDSRYLSLMYGSPLDLVSSSLRGMICAPAGEMFISADFNSIEARVLAWVAGEEKILEIFRTTGKLYEHAAAGMFKVPVEEVTPSQRQIGKVAVLALGYQGGVVAFQSMSKNLGVDVTDAEAESIKTKWRQDNPNIVRLWGKRMRQAVSAIRGVHSGDNPFSMEGGNLFLELPSGRRLCYPEATVIKKTNGIQGAAVERLKLGGMALEDITPGVLKTQVVEITHQINESGIPCAPWAEGIWVSDAISYATTDSQTKRWTRANTYGGSLVENEIQAIARDILAEALVRLDSKGFTICMHVHDEVTSIIPAPSESEEASLLSSYCSVMSETPSWAVGLPLSSAGWIARRFQK